MRLPQVLTSAFTSKPLSTLAGSSPCSPKRQDPRQESDYTIQRGWLNHSESFSGSARICRGKTQNALEWRKSSAGRKSEKFFTFRRNEREGQGIEGLIYKSFHRYPPCFLCLPSIRSSVRPRSPAPFFLPSKQSHRLSAVFRLSIRPMANLSLDRDRRFAFVPFYSGKILDI